MNDDLSQPNALPNVNTTASDPNVSASELSALLCCDCKLTIDPPLGVPFTDNKGATRCAGCHVHHHVMKRTKPFKEQRLIIETVPT